MSEYAFEGGKRSSTSISWSFATQNLPSDVSTPFSSPIGAAYQSTVLAAFARWSSVSGLNFTQVADGASVPIRIGFEAFAQAGELGETDYYVAHGSLANDTLVRLLDPAANATTISASGLYYYQTYAATMFQVALHEIGHALGLDHTTDPTNVMYPYASFLNRDLSTGDIEGINTIYPYYTVTAANPVQIEAAAGQTKTYDFTITRHGDPAAALTIGYAVVGAPYPTLTGSAAAGASLFGGVYPSGKLTFAAGSATATLTIAVAGDSAPEPDEGFAITLSSLNASDNVTVRGQVNGIMLDASGFGQVIGNSVGVYRFFDSADGAHFFSASQTERNALIQTRPDLVYEGIGLRAIASPSADAAAAPVYRFFDMSSGTHFYSVSPTERDAILATRPDLTFEGTAFYEHTSMQMGDAPVYRFFDKLDGTHFFTSSASERTSILATRSDLVDEGVGFYAPSA